jgi:hypothetical protein
VYGVLDHVAAHLYKIDRLIMSPVPVLDNIVEEEGGVEEKGSERMGFIDGFCSLY